LAKIPLLLDAACRRAAAWGVMPKVFFQCVGFSPLGHSFQGRAGLKRHGDDGVGLQVWLCSRLARTGAFLFFQSVFQFVAMSNQALSDN